MDILRTNLRTIDVFVFIFKKLRNEKINAKRKIEINDDKIINVRSTILKKTYISTFAILFDP